MGYGANQWLKTSGHNRGHHPVEVSIACSTTTTAWKDEHDIVFQIHAYRQNEWDDQQYVQYIMMSQKELEITIKKMITVASKRTRNTIAKGILASLDDPELFALLSSLFEKRSRK